ncbi:RING finger protein 223-like [Megalops cyprinoides]|uniref:RING finger protein 223-like n=1 Tax=Megalops cyprinoides TaxID=118141 RepID=UPI0018642BD5|nr:RING finger protein 223-like [Megalops cyprinoides]
MVLCEERECSVCYQAYTRWERVPRKLHCRHTFCTPCLQRMARPISGLQSVSCPLCRWKTCVAPNRSLQEALWVDSQVWDQISESDSEEQQEEEEVEESRQTQPAAQPKR